MYVGKKYTATVRKGFELEYRCKHCGFTSDTTVIGVGTGQGNSPYFLDGQGARSRAARSAGSDARKNAELTLKLCPCPKCRSATPQASSRAPLSPWWRRRASFGGSAG
jgi:hypothetical protein